MIQHKSYWEDHVMCKFCGEIYVDFYIRDELWKAVIPEDGNVCLNCFEQKLGRAINFGDIKNVSTNCNGYMFWHLFCAFKSQERPELDRNSYYKEFVAIGSACTSAKDFYKWVSFGGW